MTCSGGQLTSLYVLLGNTDPVRYALVKGSEFVAGILITYTSLTRLSISVNTSDTSVTGIRCEGNIVIGSGATQDSDTLNFTVYGEYCHPKNDYLLVVSSKEPVVVGVNAII